MNKKFLIQYNISNNIQFKHCIEKKIKRTYKNKKTFHNFSFVIIKMNILFIITFVAASNITIVYTHIHSVLILYED